MSFTVFHGSTGSPTSRTRSEHASLIQGMYCGTLRPGTGPKWISGLTGEKAYSFEKSTPWSRSETQTNSCSSSCLKNGQKSFSNCYVGRKDKYLQLSAMSLGVGSYQQAVQSQLTAELQCCWLPDLDGCHYYKSKVTVYSNGIVYLKVLGEIYNVSINQIFF